MRKGQPHQVRFLLWLTRWWSEKNVQHNGCQELDDCFAWVIRSHIMVSNTSCTMGCGAFLSIPVNETPWKLNRSGSSPSELEHLVHWWNQSKRGRYNQVITALTANKFSSVSSCKQTIAVSAMLINTIVVAAERINPLSNDDPLVNMGDSTSYGSVWRCTSSGYRECQICSCTSNINNMIL